MASPHSWLTFPACTLVEPPKDSPDNRGPPGDDVLTVPEAAELLRCSTRHLYKLVKNREVPHFRLGELIRFRRTTLASWMRQREREATHGLQIRKPMVRRLSNTRTEDGAPEPIPPVPWPERSDETPG